MAGNDPLVCEFNMRDAIKSGVLWRDRTLGVQDIRNSAGLILTAGTTPIIAQQTLTNAASATTTINAIRWATSVVNAITFTIDLPGDYNETADLCHLRLKIFKSTPGDAAINLNCVWGVVRAAVDYTTAAIVTTATPVAISDATTPSILDFAMSGKGLKGKDSISFLITPDAHATAVIDLYGGMLRFIGGTALFNETDRYATA